MMAAQTGSKALHGRLDECIRNALPYLAGCAESLKVKVHEIKTRGGVVFTRVQIDVGLSGGRQLQAVAEDGDELTAADLAFEQLELEVSLHKRGLTSLLRTPEPTPQSSDTSRGLPWPRARDDQRLLN